MPSIFLKEEWPWIGGLVWIGGNTQENTNNQFPLNGVQKRADRENLLALFFWGTGLFLWTGYGYVIVVVAFMLQAVGWGVFNSMVFF